MVGRKPKDVDEYIAAAPDAAQPLLERMRALVRQTVPTSAETVSYGMPAFRRGRVIVYFAAFKAHLGIYPPVGGDEALVAELAPWRGPKGNLAFPLGKPIPWDLIERAIVALDRQYGR